MFVSFQCISVCMTSCRVSYIAFSLLNLHLMTRTNKQEKHKQTNDINIAVEYVVRRGFCLAVN